MLECRVSFGSRAGRIDENSVVLTAGQFAYVDLDQHTVSIEAFGVDNYLAWMRGRLVFEELPLNQVCVQLNRFYQLECAYADETLKDLRLTADFSDDSVQKTLSVVALSLDITYRETDGRITWIHGHHEGKLPDEESVQEHKNNNTVQ